MCMTLKPPQASENGLWCSSLGRRLVTRESDLLRPLLRRMHGDSVLWIGEQDTMPDALTQCMIRLPLFATCTAVALSKSRTQIQSTQAVQTIQAMCQQLPFAANSLDGVVLHHSLETHADPRACIREVERVLKPGGRLLICSFNPYSFTGLRAWLARKTENPLYGRRLISPIRLLDWLALLNLKVDEIPCYSSLSAPLLRDFCYRRVGSLSTKQGKRLAQPLNVLSLGWRRIAPAVMPLFRRLPLGAVVVLSAIKEGQGGTLIGRTRLTAARKTKLVLTPTVQSQHDG